MVDTEKQPRDPPLPAPPPPPPEYSASVRLPDYYADSPQAWFCSIDATGKCGFQLQQALRHVGQPHLPAASHSERNPDGPFPPQIAVLHQRSDQPAGVPGARGFGRIGAMKRAPLPLLRQLRPPRPPGDLTPPPLLLSVPREGLSRRQVWPPSVSTPGPPRGGGSDRWCFYHSWYRYRRSTSQYPPAVSATSTRT